MTLHRALEELRAGRVLSGDLAAGSMRAILSGSCADDEIAEFLRMLAERGETAGELAAMLDAMMEGAVRLEISTRRPLIDVCGTGGDAQRTFNVSTAAAFIAAACGAAVAKHGNRSSSGGTGSADIFEGMGVMVGAPPGIVDHMIRAAGVAFVYAPAYHPSVRHAAAARRSLGSPTAFNMLGPLANPARVHRQLVGASSERAAGLIAEILAMRGAARALVVRSADGLDELSTSSRASIIEVVDGEIGPRWTADPAALGLHEADISELRVTPQTALRACIDVIDGRAPRAMAETAALNAGAALVAAGRAHTLGEGLEAASEAVSRGRASETLDTLVSMYGHPERLEEARAR